MLRKSGQDLSLADKRIRYAISLRIATLILAFFSTAWCLLQWALTSEPRFMIEGITRQFVLFEAVACAVIAASAFLYIIVGSLGWLIISARIRQLRIRAAARQSAKRSAQQLGAYI